MKIKEVTSVLEAFAPLCLQEEYDNSGLIVGDPLCEVTGVLLTLDVTENHIDEALSKGCNLIVSHHPMVFSGQKRFVGKTPVQRLIAKAIRSNVAVYACHTNIDNAAGGVSFVLGRRLGLRQMRVLRPRSGMKKLRVYAPHAAVDAIVDAMFAAGAGRGILYDECGFVLQGTGCFRARQGADPFVGNIGERHYEPETAIEMLVAPEAVEKVLGAMRQAHPYQEVGYDLYSIDLPNPHSGTGVIGTIDACDAAVFLQRVKTSLGLSVLRHSPVVNKQVCRVALCGGSGASFVRDAVALKADIFLTGDLKYHDFMDASGVITIADVGHYESEKYTIDLFYDFILKKIPTFVVCKTQLSSNPIIYL